MSGPEAHRHTDLEQIEAALRADSPTPRPEFAAVLDRRVSEGFPKRRRRPRFSPSRRWVPALAATAVLIVVAAVGISVLQRDQTERVTGAFHAKVKGGPSD